MSRWKDITSYSQSQLAAVRYDRLKLESDSWELRSRRMRVVVHQHVHYKPGQWLLSVNGTLIVDKRELLATDADAAKEEALGYLRELVADLQREVESL